MGSEMCIRDSNISVVLATQSRPRSPQSVPPQSIARHKNILPHVGNLHSVAKIAWHGPKTRREEARLRPARAAVSKDGWMKWEAQRQQASCRRGVGVVLLRRGHEVRCRDGQPLRIPDCTCVGHESAVGESVWLEMCEKCVRPKARMCSRRRTGPSCSRRGPSSDIQPGGLGFVRQQDTGLFSYCRSTGDILYPLYCAPRCSKNDPICRERL